MTTLNNPIYLKTRRKSLSLTLLLLIFVKILSIELSIAQSLSINWNNDINFLAVELPRKHYNFFNSKDRLAFKTGIDKIKSGVDTSTNLQIAIRLQQLIASFGDSHTKINFIQFHDQNKILPLHLYWFSDGLYILHTTTENTAILGHQIISINDFPLQAIADSLRTLITVDNEAILKIAISKTLPLVSILEHFKFVDGSSISLTVKSHDGQIKTHDIKPALLNRQNRKSFKPDSLALCYKNETAFFIDYYLPNEGVYYLQYNKCWSKELELQNGNPKNAEKMPSFEEYKNQVFQTLTNNKVQKIVFDIRFNEGGNSMQGTDFIKMLSAYTKKNDNIQLYVITGKHTFSSAVLNAMDFKQFTNAIFVGEETAGKPNHFGEVKHFKLPASELKVNYSTKYFKRSEQKLNTLTPDFKIETSFLQFKKGIDPVYEWIINH